MRKHNYKEYYRTEKGFINKLFNTMKTSSKHRGMNLPDFTIEEFALWLYKNKFKELFENWKDSVFNTKLSPSVDRLNDYKPYTFSNIRLVTWEENKKKGDEDRKNGVNNKISKAVNQVNKLTGEIINTFHSISEASRRTGINRQNINSCCRGKLNSAGGFKWEYT